MGSYVMAIDQGTTGTTVLVLDRRLGLRAKVNQEFRQIFPKPGWVEHDLEDIWSSTLSTVQRALREAGARGSDIAAIGITNQRETTVLWERATGRPVAPPRPPLIPKRPRSARSSPRAKCSTFRSMAATI